jgi:hypothetical protein
MHEYSFRLRTSGLILILTAMPQRPTARKRKAFEYDTVILIDRVTQVADY